MNLTLEEFLVLWWKQIDKSLPRDTKIELLLSAAQVVWGGRAIGDVCNDIKQKTQAWINSTNPM